MGHLLIISLTPLCHVLLAPRLNGIQHQTPPHAAPRVADMVSAYSHLASEDIEPLQLCSKLFLSLWHLEGLCHFCV